MPKIEKRGNTYRTRVFAGTDADGKKHWKSISHPDPKKLKRLAAEYEDAHREYVTRNTVTAAIRKYIDSKARTFSPATVRVYRSYEKVLEDSYSTFAHTELPNVNRFNLQQLVNQLQDDGKTPKYIRNIYGLVTATLSANDLKAPKVTLPEARQSDLYEPTKDDIRRTIAAARGTTLEIPILLGVHGLRRGEICALRWPDDFDGNSVHISRDVVYGYKQELHTKAPKTARSDRIVPLASEVVELIREQGYVTHMTLAAISHAFPRLLAKNGIPRYRFHDLRHFFASYMHDLGFSDAQIMQMGGWQTDNVMKRVYRYALTDDNFADMVNSAVGDLL